MHRDTYWLNRASRHSILFVAAAVITLLAYLATPPPDVRHRLSMGTAYAGLTFLAASLWLGPWNVLGRKPNPVSFDLRRDIGIWAGVLAVVHTTIGLTVHLRGRMWMYFFKQFHPLTVQNTQFGLANYMGLLAVLVFFLLLAISNDLSLRNLGIRRWKSLQRWAYAAFGLTFGHAVAYQLVEKRHLPWVLIFASLSFAVVSIQVWAFVHIHFSGNDPADGARATRQMAPQVLTNANGIHKNIGWHTFRHSFGTLLKANGGDVRTVQELLRYANRPDHPGCLHSGGEL